MLKPLLLAAAAAFSLSAGASRVDREAVSPFDVLDGDTVVTHGVAVRLRGFDAPELGPWARCWAEAALAGHAREELQRSLGETERGWRLVDHSAPDARGRRTARLVDREGYDISDELVVAGAAAMTDARWDWCGGDANLHHVLQDEPPPHGPNLWWPSGPMFDPRAAD